MPVSIRHVTEWSKGMVKRQGGRLQGGGLHIKSLWPEWEKDALYWWKSFGVSFLNARGQTASCAARGMAQSCFEKVKVYAVFEKVKVYAGHQPACMKKRTH
eukprot:1156440-Pelagomonas_calceolata.AAC.10